MASVMVLKCMVLVSNSVVLLLVFHSWHGKFETYLLKDVKIYLLYYLHSYENALHYLLFIIILQGYWC